MAARVTLQHDAVRFLDGASRIAVRGVAEALIAPSDRPPLRVRARIEPAHERQVEFPERRGVLRVGCEASYQQLPQPAHQPRAVAQVTLDPGADSRARRSRPDLGPSCEARYRPARRCRSPMLERLLYPAVSPVHLDGEQGDRPPHLLSQPRSIPTQATDECARTGREMSQNGGQELINTNRPMQRTRILRRCREMVGGSGNGPKVRVDQWMIARRPPRLLVDRDPFQAPLQNDVRHAHVGGLVWLPLRCRPQSIACDPP